MPRCSVIIPSYNGAATIRMCLESIVPQAQAADAEIIVIDSSTDGTYEIVKSEFPTVRLFHFPTRMYPDEARTFAIAQTSADIIAFTDADCTVNPEWLNEKIRLHDEGHEIVFGAIRCHPQCNLIGWGYYFVEFSFFLRYLAPGYVKSTSNCNLSLKRSLFSLVQYRQEKLMSLDAQLIRDFHTRGKRPYYDPSHTVYHYYIGSLARMLQHFFHLAYDCVLIDYQFGTVRKGRRIFYLIGWPLLPMLKIAFVFPVLIKSKREYLGKFFLCLPYTLAGSAAWVSGACWAHLAMIWRGK
ncbi:MAG: glycosyltransferase [bacterium]